MNRILHENTSDISYGKPYPYHVFIVDGLLYLDGYCIERKEIRCFKACRIRSVCELGLTFSNLREYDFARRRTNVFGIYASDLEPEHVKVWFSVEVAPFIREESRHASQKITENPDGSLFFEVDVAEPEEVLWWALGRELRDCRAAVAPGRSHQDHLEDGTAA